MNVTFYKIEEYQSNNIWNKELFTNDRYIAKYFFNNGYQYVLLGTPTKKQVHIHNLHMIQTTEVTYEDVKKLHPHLPKAIKKR